MMNKFRAILLIAILALAAGACGAGAERADSDVADSGSQAADGRFFVEEFDGQLPGWYDEILGDEGQAHTSIIDGSFVFEIETEYTYAYTFYGEESYADVHLTADVENQGDPDNYLTLVCRASDEGWYEFNIGSDGLWAVIFYSSAEEDFVILDDGSSEAINLNLASNRFEAVCEGQDLTLIINGETVSTITHGAYMEGEIGISVASFGSLPVKVAFDRLEVSAP